MMFAKNPVAIISAQKVKIENITNKFNFINKIKILTLKR